MTAPMNDQQFAKYSAVEQRGAYGQTEIVPRPAYLERHAPGQYQPTLPGMEGMIPNERTHTSVVFNHPNAAKDEYGWVPGSRWHTLTNNYNPAQVSAKASTLRPTQDWLDDPHLHQPISETTMADQGTRPKVESIYGRMNVIHDGHHRAAREILNGHQFVDVDRWGRDKDY